MQNQGDEARKRNDPLSQEIERITRRAIEESLAAIEVALTERFGDAATLTTTAVDVEGVRKALIAAYTTGATDVHEAWMSRRESRDPDFTEAAHNYAIAALSNLPTSKEAGEP